MIDYGIPLLNNFHALSALERALEAQVPAMKHRLEAADVPAPEVRLSAKDREVAAALLEVDQQIARSKLNKKEQHITNVYKKFEPVLRPPTPTVRYGAVRCAALWCGAVRRAGIRNAFSGS